MEAWMVGRDRRHTSSHAQFRAQHGKLPQMAHCTYEEQQYVKLLNQ